MACCSFGIFQYHTCPVIHTSSSKSASYLANVAANEEMKKNWINLLLTEQRRVPIMQNYSSSSIVHITYEYMRELHPQN